MGDRAGVCPSKDEQEEETLTAQQMWLEFIKKYPDAADKEMSAWCYGSDAADDLAELTVKGIKTATASAYPIYAIEGEELPKAGEYSVIQRTDETAVCVVRTSRVYVVPFRDVSQEHAWREGEGDRSLDYWRKVHEEFFSWDMKQAGLIFSEDMEVVCEEFCVVYPSIL